MLEGNTGVNSASPSTGASPASEGQFNQGQLQSTPSSAETLKTDSPPQNGSVEEEFPSQNPGWPEGVYERFKKVNEQRKELATKFEQAQKHLEQFQPYLNSEGLQNLQTYQQFDELLTTDPQLADIVQKTVNQYFEQRNASITPEQRAMLEQRQILSKQQETIQSMVSNQYQQELDSFLQAEGYEDPTLKTLIGAFTQAVFEQQHPQLADFMTYDKGAAQKTIEVVKQALGKLGELTMAGYQKKKAAVATPPSGSSSMPVPVKMDGNKDLGGVSRHELVNMMADKLRSANQGQMY